LERITDAFVWPFRDPEWATKLAIIALILLIPILGAINGMGWMLAALDRLRAGEERLPPANFDYLGRGVGLFVVNLVYVLALLIVGGVLYGLAVVILATQGHDTPNAFLVAVAFALLLLAFGVVSIGSLALTFAMPSIVLAVSRGGIAAGLHVEEIVRTASTSPVNTLIAGLMLIVVSFVEGLGGVVCCIGIVFTVAYALAMQAWIVRSFEVGSSPIHDT
jgi:hypothetical protein